MASTSIMLHPKGEIEVGSFEYHNAGKEGECYLEFYCGESTITIHSLTAESLERLGGRILDAAQRQRDRDGRKLLEASKAAAIQQADEVLGSYPGMVDLGDEA